MVIVLLLYLNSYILKGSTGSKGSVGSKGSRGLEKSKGSKGSNLYEINPHLISKTTFDRECKICLLKELE